MTLTLRDASARFPRRCTDSILAIDAHTAGEPLRVLVDGGPSSGFRAPQGRTMLAQRAWAQEYADDLRRRVILEPRGHADMYACWLTDPVTDDGDVGVLFLHNEGFSTMCGHGIIGLVKVGLTYGLFTTAVKDQVRIDTPAGRVTAHAHRDQKTNNITSVSFLNVPSFVLSADAQVEVPGHPTPIRFDLAFGGAFYAYVDAADLGLELNPDNYGNIVDWGKRLKAAVSQQHKIRHPASPTTGSGLDFLYGVIFVAPSPTPNIHSRNVCVFADGEVDRSPTGTGVSGRAAIEVHTGRLGLHQPIEIESILATTFEVQAETTTTIGPQDQQLLGIIPKVTGQAFIAGINELLVDPEDSLIKGFLLR